MSRDIYEQEGLGNLFLSLAYCSLHILIDHGDS